MKRRVGILQKLYVTQMVWIFQKHAASCTFFLYQKNGLRFHKNMQSCHYAKLLLQRLYGPSLTFTLQLVQLMGSWWREADFNFSLAPAFPQQ